MNRCWVMLAVLVVSSASAAERVLFAFDDVAIPLRDNLQLTMTPAEKCERNPVLRRGETGTPDHGQAVLYGSVIQEGGKFRMWYLASPNRLGEAPLPDVPAWWRPMCYAESEDGIHWTKPDFGLVEFNGSKHN